jgi:hypothetical protein
VRRIWKDRGMKKEREKVEIMNSDGVKYNMIVNNEGRCERRVGKKGENG